MFFRRKRVENRTYLQIVENHRDGAKTRQKVLLTLGRLEDLYEKDRFDKLIQSGARFSQQLMMLSALKEGSLDHCSAKGFTIEWERAKLDLDCLEEITVVDQKREMLLRNDADGSVPALFRSAGITLPPRMRNPKPPPEPRKQL